MGLTTTLKIMSTYRCKIPPILKEQVQEPSSYYYAHDLQMLNFISIKLYSHSLRAIILQNALTLGLQLTLSSVSKIKMCRWHDFIFIFIFFPQSHSIHLLFPLQDNFQSMIHLSNICLCICDIWFKFSSFFLIRLFVYLCIYLGFALLHTTK